MSNNQPAYMGTAWFAGLLREVNAASVTAVAKKIGIARPTLSLLIHGKGMYGAGLAKTDNIETRYRQAYEQLTCPHTQEQVGIAHCRDMALRNAPSHNPLQMIQWQACQGCNYKPAPAAPADAAPEEARPMQQAGIIDKVTLPLPEVGGPQIAD